MEEVQQGKAGHTRQDKRQQNVGIEEAALWADRDKAEVVCRLAQGQRLSASKRHLIESNHTPAAIQVSKRSVTSKRCPPIRVMPKAVFQSSFFWNRKSVFQFSFIGYVESSNQIDESSFPPPPRSVSLLHFLLHLHCSNR